MSYRRMGIVCILASTSLCLLQPAMAANPAPTFAYVCRDAGAGGYQAFPDVCRLQDGRLMCVFYASYCHVGLPCPQRPKGGRIACCTSSDDGHTWSKAETLCDGPDDDRDPSVVQLPSGRILCNFFTLHRKAPADKPCPEPFKEPYIATGVWIVASDDLGKTWSEARKVYDPYYTCSSPIRILSNGRLIMPLYADSSEEGASPKRGVAFGAVGISDDGGKTWNKPIDIDNAGVYLDAETDLIQLRDQRGRLSGKLYAVERTDLDSAYFATSADYGDTWSTSRKIGFNAHCPYLHRTPAGIILLGYRDFSSGAITALRYSLDECQTWSGKMVVDTVAGGYPSMVSLNDGSVLIVYYEEGANASIRAKRFRVTRAGVKWLSL